jgi:hypothetical protein
MRSLVKMKTEVFKTKNAEIAEKNFSCGNLIWFAIAQAKIIAEERINRTFGRINQFHKK